MRIFSVTSSKLWPNKCVRIFMPILPAIRYDSGFPAVVNQTGNSFCTGRGKVSVSTMSPIGFSNATFSPRQSFLTISIWSNITCLLFLWFCGMMTKSFGCQPAAKLNPTRPSLKLSITDQSSAIRTGWCKGETILPERILRFLVIAANAALVTAGFGYGPPKAEKCRSGVQTELNPFSSKYFAPSISNRYFLLPGASSLPHINKPKPIERRCTFLDTPPLSPLRSSR